MPGATALVLDPARTRMLAVRTLPPVGAPPPMNERFTRQLSLALEGHLETRCQR
ncbi:hypothetical protein [Brachybacterium vulturis]|uniref:hypothetical protein n=1 Tax=Brachybacterium vulturis TaxID=2017484 RepID=UPI003735516C